MDEIEKRLRESADSCVQFYEAWRKNEKDSAARESLHDSVHELRKVASRLEIEMAISERNEVTGKPLPIPPHRSSRKKQEGGNEGADLPASAGRGRRSAASDGNGNESASGNGNGGRNGNGNGNDGSRDNPRKSRPRRQPLQKK